MILVLNLRFYQTASDAHTYRVIDVYCFNDAVEVHYQVSPWASEGFQRIRGPSSAMVFLPQSPDDIGGSLLKNVRSQQVARLDEVLSGLEQTAAQTHCILQPEPVVCLLLHGMWTEVSVLARCLKTKRRSHRNRLFKDDWDVLLPGYPSGTWVREQFANIFGMEDDDDEEAQPPSMKVEALTADKLMELRCDIRAWTPGIVDNERRGAGDDKEEGELAAARAEKTLAKHIGRLASWEQTLRGEGVVKPQGHGSGRYRYDVSVLLNVFRASRHLRNRAAAEKTFERLLEVTWPGLLTEEAKAFPRDSTIKRSALVADAGLLLLQQHSNRTSPDCRIPPFYRYGWSDSSPIFGRDWFLSKHIRLRSSEAFACLQAAHALSHDRLLMQEEEARAAMEDADEGPSETALPPLADIARQERGEPIEEGRADQHPAAARLEPTHRRSLCSLLVQELQVHVHIPCSLGLGSTDIAHKVACLAHSVGVETESAHDMVWYMKGVTSWCTDMGTELGTTQFRASSLEMLPPWWQWSSALEDDLEAAVLEDDRPQKQQLTPRSQERTMWKLDGEDGGGDFGDDLEVEEDDRMVVLAPETEADDTTSDEDDSPQFMSSALCIPGLMHISHNLAIDVMDKLAWFPNFWKQLKNIESLLCHPDRMRLVVEKCIVGSMYAHMKPLFLLTAPNLYEKRWSAIQQFLSFAWPRLLALRYTWDEECLPKASRDNDPSNSGYGFSAAQLTETLKSNMFFGYFSMVSSLTTQVHSIAAWSEGCHCHELVGVGKSRYARDKALEPDFGPSHFGCPLETMRLPELVAGDWLAAQQRAIEVAQTELLTQTQVWCSPQEWHQILSEFHVAQAELAMNLKIKTSFTAKLPWMLAGLAHYNPGVVQRIAKEAIDAYDSTPEETRKDLHKEAHRFLSPTHRLRAEMEKLAAGVALGALSRRAQRHISKLRFISLSERVIEAGHKDIKTSSEHHKLGEIAVSSAVRTTFVLERQARLQPDMIHQLVKCVAACRRAKDMPQKFHLQKHPEVLHLRHQRSVGKPPQTTTWAAVFAKVLYRCDPDAMFNPLEKQVKEHDRQARREHARATRLLGERRVVGHGEILAHNFVEHLREVVPSGGLCSFLAGPWPLAPLEGALSHIPQLATQQPQHKVVNRVVFLGDGEQAEGEQESGVQPRVFVRFLHKHPRALKTVAMPRSLGGKVDDRCIAVVREHELNEVGDKPTIAPNKEGSVELLGPFSAADVQRFREAGNLEGALLWPEDGGAISYRMSNFFPADGDMAHVSWAIEQLLSHQALVGSPHFFTLEHGHLANKILGELAQSGFVRAEVMQGRSQWRLTHRGANGVVFARTLARGPMDLASPRPDGAIKLADRTCFELLCMLCDAGWAWQQLPSTRHKRHALAPYRVGDPLVYRTSGIKVSKAYLQCLLSAQQLQTKFGNGEVPHGQADPTYARILHGEKWCDIKDAIEDASGRTSRRRHQVGGAAILDGFDGEAEELEDSAPAFPPIASEAANVDASESDAGSQASGFVWVAAAEEGGASEQDGVLVGPASDAPAELHGGDAELDGSADNHRAPGAEQARPVAAADDAGAVLQAMRNLRRRWGIFGFTYKQPGTSSGGRYGGLQADCPLHKRSAKTGCRKFVKVTGACIQDFDTALCKLKWWCVQGQRVDRQWQHVFSTPLEPVPAMEVLEGMLLHERPGVPVDDETFYAGHESTMPPVPDDGGAAPAPKRRRLRVKTQAVEGCKRGRGVDNS